MRKSKRNINNNKKPFGKKSIYDQSFVERAYDAAPATATDLAVLFGVSRKTIWEWAKIHEDFGDALDYCLSRREQDLINKALTGKVNWAFAKYLLSAQHGIVEKNEVKNEIVGKDGDEIKQQQTQIYIVYPNNENNTQK